MEEENHVDKSRKHYSPQQKVAIFGEHLIEQVGNRCSRRRSLQTGNPRCLRIHFEQRLRQSVQNRDWPISPRVY
jgi:hypothetical protein